MFYIMRFPEKRKFIPEKTVCQGTDDQDGYLTRPEA